MSLLYVTASLQSRPCPRPRPRSHRIYFMTVCTGHWHLCWKRWGLQHSEGGSNQGQHDHLRQHHTQRPCRQAYPRMLSCIHQAHRKFGRFCCCLTPCCYQECLLQRSIAMQLMAVMAVMAGTLEAAEEVADCPPVTRQLAGAARRRRRNSSRRRTCSCR